MDFTCLVFPGRPGETESYITDDSDHFCCVCEMYSFQVLFNSRVFWLYTLLILGSRPHSVSDWSPSELNQTPFS